jgi:proteasome lid subunit RPN8/RPN11
MTKSNKYEDTPKIQILESVYEEIRNTIGSRPAESGGLPFGKEEDMVVRAFIFDKDAHTTRSTYSFNTDFLNPEIKKMWNEKGYSCLGFIHSHPYGFGRPSHPDIEYFSSMFDSMPRPYYITPIIFTKPDGGFKFNPFIIINGERDAKKVELEILPDEEQSKNGENKAFTSKGKNSQDDKEDETFKHFDNIQKIIAAYSSPFQLPLSYTVEKEDILDCLHNTSFHNQESNSLDLAKETHWFCWGKCSSSQSFYSNPIILNEINNLHDYLLKRFQQYANRVHRSIYFQILPFTYWQPGFGTCLRIFIMTEIMKTKQIFKLSMFGSCDNLESTIEKLKFDEPQLGKLKTKGNLITY